MMQDMKKIVQYSPAFNRSGSKSSEFSGKSGLSGRSSRLPSIRLHTAREKKETKPMLHKNRMKKLIKISQRCGLNINVVKEEVLRYQGEKQSIEVANFIEKEIRSRVNMFSSEVRFQMKELEKLKKEWDSIDISDDLSCCSSIITSEWESENSSLRLFTQ